MTTATADIQALADLIAVMKTTRDADQVEGKALLKSLNDVGQPDRICTAWKRQFKTKLDAANDAIKKEQQHLETLRTERFDGSTKARRREATSNE